MRLAPVVLLLVPMSAHASSPDWMGQAIERSIDLGPEAGVVGVVDTHGRADLAFDTTFRVGLYRPTKSWFANPGLELNVSFAFPVAWDWWQVRTGVGTAVGPVSLVLAYVADIVKSGEASALSPEVRIRHRTDGLKPASFGFFARIDMMLVERDQHPDRFAIGVFGALDVL